MRGSPLSIGVESSTSSFVKARHSADSGDNHPVSLLGVW